MKFLSVITLLASFMISSVVQAGHAVEELTGCQTVEMFLDKVGERNPTASTERLPDEALVRFAKRWNEELPVTNKNVTDLYISAKPSVLNVMISWFVDGCLARQQVVHIAAFQDYIK